LNDKTAVFLFPGQGARYRGAAIDFLDAGSPGARELFALASEACGRDMRALLADGSEEELKRTDVAQPALTLCALAAAAFLSERGWRPALCAGFSLGEYPALACAGVLSAADCFKLVVARGKAMQDEADRALAEHGGDANLAPGMMAVVGLALDKALELIEGWKESGVLKDEGLSDLYPANLNSPSQLVASGTAAALSRAEGLFAAAGARVTRLRVAGPFHSPLMSRAAEAFAVALADARFGDPEIPLFSNVTGEKAESGEEAKRLALLHVTSPVQWAREQRAVARAMGELGAAACLEVGPGKVLRGLWRDSGAETGCLSAESVADIEKLDQSA